jgi:hypothetical protein
MTESLGTNKAEVASSEQRLRELNQKVETLTLTEQHVETYVKAMETCLAIKQEAQEATSKLNRERESLEAKRAEMEEMGIKEAVGVAAARASSECPRTKHSPPSSPHTHSLTTPRHDSN